MLRKVIGVFGLLLGFSIIGVTLYSGYKGDSVQKEALSIVESIYSNNENLTEEEVKIAEGAVGIVNIPSLNIKSVIMTGVDQETLKYYVGHFPDSAKPGELGNFSIIGHNNNIHNKVFTDLKKIQLGDEIEIITTDGKFVYEVTGKSEVYPKETYVLDWNGKDKEITVITCTKDSKKRTIIKGILK